MNAYHSCLRQLVSICEFAKIDKKIKSQIIQSCPSQRLRYKASRDGTMTLDAFLDEARALEVSEKQAKDIEPSESANSVLPQPPETPHATCMPRETPSCSDDGYAFWAETPVDKVSAPLVSLKVNGVKCNFLVDSGASENILSSFLLIVIGYATATELDILRTANAASVEKTFS